MKRTKKVVPMLVISCVLVLLLIPLAGCQPVVVQGPQEPAGPQGPEGPMGPRGLQGPPGSARCIMVGKETEVAEVEDVAIWRAYIGDRVVIMGAGFLPDRYVTITSGGRNRVWGEAVSNSDGAFRLNMTIPSWVDTARPSTIRAWVDLDNDGDLEEGAGELRACWPLRVMR
jgi:hypothetical protein